MGDWEGHKVAQHMFTSTTKRWKNALGLHYWGISMTGRVLRWYSTGLKVLYIGGRMVKAKITGEYG